MKRISVLVLITAAIMSFAACSGQAIEAQTEAPASVKTPTVTSSPTAEPEPSPTDEGTPVSGITEGPIPGLLGSKWYDWDKVGAYPGASVTQCGDRIAFQLLKYRREMDYDFYLAFADPDGSSVKSTKIKDPRSPNYKDGWVYFISEKDNSINKVRTDGKGQKCIYKMRSSLPETKEILLSDILLIDDRIYVFENIQYGNKYKSTLKRIGLDGKGAETLGEFEHAGPHGESDIDKYDITDYISSFFYDSGKLYYTDTDLFNNKFDLYSYDIAAGGKVCLAKGLPADYDCKIAVREDEVYYDTEEGMRVYTISTGKDEVFAPAKGIGFMDFAFFDRWLLMTSDDGLYCYDLDSGKMYLSEDVGSADIVPARDSLYLEGGEEPFLYPVLFENGEVTTDECFNWVK